MRKLPFIILLGFLGILVFFLASLIYSNYSSKQEAKRAREELREAQLTKYGTELLSLCQNVEPTVKSEFPVTDGTPKLLILEAGTQHAHTRHEELPAAQYPQSAAEVDLVVCMGGQGVGERVEVDRCPYKDTERVVIRYRVDSPVVVIDPTSGNVVAVDQLRGSDPGGCPFSIPNTGKDQEQFGAPPQTGTILAWVKSQAELVRSQIFGETILAMCESPGEPDFSLQQLDEIPRILVLETGSNRVHDWYANLQDAWKATEAADIDLIVCVPPVTDESIETVKVLDCDFLITSDAGRDIEGTKTIPVYQRVVTAVLIDPETGIAISSMQVEGRPRSQDFLSGGVGCPQTIQANDFEGIYGDLPNAIDLQGAFYNNALVSR